MKSAHPAKGKFRVFLLACLKHYAANEWDKRVTAKRNRGQPILSIDEIQAEERYRIEPADLDDPAKIFARRWAFTVVERTIEQLRKTYSGEGKAAIFEALVPHLTGDAERGDHRRIAACFQMNEGVVRVEAFKMRKRYRDLLLKEIASTVEDPGEVDAEVRELFALFSR